MMTFEEEFPSLKGKGKSEQLGTKNAFMEPYYYEHSIKKHCLDKKRVRDIIDKKISHSKDKKFKESKNISVQSWRDGAIFILNHLKKELGL